MTAPGDTATLPRPQVRRLVVAALCAALVVGGWALTAAGALDRNPAWTADSGPVVAWGLPLTRLLGHGFAVLTVGFLLGAVVFAPVGSGGQWSAAARRHAGVAAATAGLWAVASFCHLWFATADLTGVGLLGVEVSAFTDIGAYTLQGRALLIAVAAATGVQLCVGLVRRPGGALCALLIAVAGILPFAFTGHAATSGDHNTATSSLALHILASSVWVGGLVALLAHARWQPSGLPLAARRFSRLALVCFGAVAGTGALNAWLRLRSVDNLLNSDYGLLLQLKTLALVALAAAGWWHRERTMPALHSDRPAERRLFARFAAAEVVVMAASFGLATALARSIPPRPPAAGGHSVSEMLLGYPMPPAPTATRLLLDWRPDLFFALGCAAALLAYLLGLRRLRRAGSRWPVWRVSCWLGGLLALSLATSSGLARYGPVLFSAHLGQHLLAAVLAPALLVCGAPAALALRALAASPDEQHPGAREWLTAALHSRAARVLTRLPVAGALWMAGAYVTYLAGGYEYALRNHPAHLALYSFFVASGCLFFRSLLRAGALPGWVPAVLGAALLGHLLLGLVMIRTGGPFAAAWFAELQRPWSVDPAADQVSRGAVGWLVGHVPALVATALVLVRSVRAGRATPPAGPAPDGGDRPEPAPTDPAAARPLQPI